jgi:hypothetical protein
VWRFLRCAGQNHPRTLFGGCIDCYIAEDSPDTKGLWDSTSGQIDAADIFIADISSASPNILLEVGCAVGRKPVGTIGLFLASSVTVPSDLRNERTSSEQKHSQTRAERTLVAPEPGSNRALGVALFPSQ